MVRTLSGVLYSLSVIAVILFLSFIVLNIPASEQFYDAQVSSVGALQPAHSGDNVGSPDPVRASTVFMTYQGVNTYSDSTSLLNARYCYQFPQVLTRGDLKVPDTNPANGLVSYTTFGCHTVPIEGEFASVSDINSRIIQELSTVQTSSGSSVKGSVYVLITQVPYFVNFRGNPINIGYDVEDSTAFWPTGGNNPRQSIFCRLYIIFANYDPSTCVYNPANTHFECQIISQYNKNYVSNDKQCFIRCLQSGIACGCASSTTGTYTSPNDAANYKIQCMGRDSVHQDQLAASTYAVIYSVNPQYSLATPYFRS